MRYIIILFMSLFIMLFMSLFMIGCTSGEKVYNALSKNGLYPECEKIATFIQYESYVNTDQLVLITNLVYMCESKNEILNAIKEQNEKTNRL